MLGQRPEQAAAICHETRDRWQWLLDHLDDPLVDAEVRLGHSIARRSAEAGRPAYETIFRALQDYSLRVSWKTEVREALMQLFDGRAFDGIRGEIEAIHKRMLKSRVFVALHMHAGDGNVHTNIPVNSDDYGMLQEANAAVSRIMSLAKSLGGVISGEHGIGITKLDYLEPGEMSAFRDYKERVDPHGRFKRRQTARGREPRQRVHTVLRPARHREPDPRTERHRRDLRLHQGLPALRQVQARVRDARAARKPALLAAQQDPRDVPADRGVPVRGADAARRLVRALRRVR